ncbi:hypothetical protein Taro_030984, partial [Colocasia esculenta]|nr:hypothetical protein [Colocasia esculenta]
DIFGTDDFRWWLVQWFEATEIAYCLAADYLHTLHLEGICNCSLDGWFYNLCSRLGVKDMNIRAPPELIFRWDRTANTNKEMLIHMSSMHHTWRGVLKKRHYTGKSFEDVIASVPAGVNPHDWQIMCEKWNTSDEQCLAHDRDLNRVEIFKIGKCKKLPDGLEQWVDDESRSRYVSILSATSLDSESGSTPISSKEAFVSVIGKDQSGRIRCGGSWETCRTWYGTGEGSNSFDYHQQISNIENNLRMEVEELRTEARRRDSEMDEMRKELEQLRK